MSITVSDSRAIATLLNRCVAVLALAVLAAGCATTVQVNARFPARNVPASELRKIAISEFDGPDGGNFASGLQAELASARFDGNPYFTLVDAGRGGIYDARTAASYGRSVGAQGVYFGRVDTASFFNERFDGTDTVCAYQDDKGNCKKWEVVTIPCLRRTAQMAVVPTLVRVPSGEVVYSTRKSAARDTSWCRGQSQSVSDDSLIAGTRQQILGDIRLDVAPYNAILKATIKESSDGLSEDVAKMFDGAVASAKKNDMGEACRLWQSVDKTSPNHAWTVYDLGVCSEANGDYAIALQLYERSRTLSPKVDRDVAESIARVSRLISADAELKRQQKVREDQIAAASRQRAESEKQAKAVAKQAKAAQDARHAQLVAKFGPKVAANIEAGKVQVGMSMDAVIATLGNPARKENIPPNSALWHYGSQEIGFTKGKVTSVSH